MCGAEVACGQCRDVTPSTVQHTHSPQHPSLARHPNAVTIEVTVKTDAPCFIDGVMKECGLAMEDLLSFEGLLHPLNRDLPRVLDVNPSPPHLLALVLQPQHLG